MSDFTHRDRRAHRDVNRAFWTVTGISVGLTVVALELPLPYAGVAAVVAMGLLGLAYLGWAERLLGTYASDLRQAKEGMAMDGFVRVEVTSTVGLDRDGRSGSSPSPHARRRPPGYSAGEATRDSPGESDRDQA